MSHISTTETPRSVTAQDLTSSLTPLQQRILGFIVERSVLSGGEVCCTKREIAQAMHCNARTVDRAIVRLRAEGIIEACPRFGENGGQEGNAYRPISRYDGALH